MPEFTARMRNGMRHTGTVSTSFKTRAFTLNPQLNITDRMYFDAVRKTYDPGHGYTVVTDTVPGIATPFDWSAAPPLTSKLYGMYVFRGGRLKPSAT
jgi:hypothetical protein